MADEFNTLDPLWKLDNCIFPVTIDEVHEFVDGGDEFPDVTEQKQPDNGQRNSS